MKAVKYQGHGSPAKTIHLADVAQPEIKENEILVKVETTAVTPTDTVSRGGDSLLVRVIEKLFGGNSVPGDVFAGEVVNIGAAVEKFSIGEKVFGTLAPNTGAHAEFLKIKEDAVVARRPQNLSSIEAAALVDGPLTSHAFLRKIANIQPGQTVLINGASGSLGTAGVQLAKHFGAKVIGVCSTKNIDFVKSLGADEVIDYTKEDFTKRENVYDFVYDTVWKSSYQKCKKALKPEGMYMTSGPSLAIVIAFLATRFTKQKAVMGATGPFWKQSEMEYIAELASQGILTPIIDSTYSFDKAGVIATHEKVETGHKVGSVVITVKKKTLRKCPNK